MEVKKYGDVLINRNKYTYLVPNFVEQKSSDGWTFNSTTPVFNDGYTQMTGKNPNFNSTSFTVEPDEIICVEFSVSLPTISTTTSGHGIYIGAKNGQSFTSYYYKFSTKEWSLANETITNFYFLSSYNKTDIAVIKSYIIGYNVDTADVPPAYRLGNCTHDVLLCKLKETDTSTTIRTGYNTNTEMVINIYDMKVYSLNKNGLSTFSSKFSMGNGYVSCNEIYEY